MKAETKRRVSNRAIARAIARELFVTPNGAKADYLAMLVEVDEITTDRLGSWTLPQVVDLIELAMNEAEAP